MQGRFEEAKSEVLCAAEIFEKLGAVRDLKRCRELFKRIQEVIDNPAATHELGRDGKLLKTVLFPSLLIPHSQVRTLNDGIDVRFCASVIPLHHLPLHNSMHIPLLLSL